MSKEDKFYDLRSELESAMTEFYAVCQEDDRDFDEEVEEIKDEVKKPR